MKHLRAFPPNFLLTGMKDFLEFLTYPFSRKLFCLKFMENFPILYFTARSQPDIPPVNSPFPGLPFNYVSYSMFFRSSIPIGLKINWNSSINSLNPLDAKECSRTFQYYHVLWFILLTRHFTLGMLLGCVYSALQQSGHQGTISLSWTSWKFWCSYWAKNRGTQQILQNMFISLSFGVHLWRLWRFGTCSPARSGKAAGQVHLWTLQKVSTYIYNMVFALSNLHLDTIPRIQHSILVVFSTLCMLLLPNWAEMFGKCNSSIHSLPLWNFPGSWHQMAVIFWFCTLTVCNSQTQLLHRFYFNKQKGDFLSYPLSVGTETIVSK